MAFAWINLAVPFHSIYFRGQKAGICSRRNEGDQEPGEVATTTPTKKAKNPQTPEKAELSGKDARCW